MGDLLPWASVTTVPAWGSMVAVVPSIVHMARRLCL